MNTYSMGGGNDPIDGITCDVTNCVYHEEGSLCTAREIKVGPQYAASSADTVCATFKPKYQ